jgi:signal transduction histidine kinase
LCLTFGLGLDLRVRMGPHPWTSPMARRTIPGVTAASIGRTAVGAVGALGLLVALVLAIGGVHIDAPVGPGFGLTQILLGVLPLYALAVFLMKRRPDNQVSWYLLLTVSTLAVVVAAEASITVALRASDPGGWFWAANLAYQWTVITSNVASTAALVLFPDGHAERQWQEVLVHWLWALLAVPPLLLLCRPQLVVFPLPLKPPITPVSPAFVPWLAGLGAPLEAAFRGQYAVVLVGGAIFAWRYVRAGASQRRRMRWAAHSLQLFIALALATFLVQVIIGPGPELTVLGRLLTVAEVGIVVGIVIGVLRYRLFDINLVIRRSVVFGALTLGIAAVYAGVASVPGLALGRFIPVELAVLLTIAAALAFQPARARLTALADRWVFGHQIDGRQLLLSLGATLEHAVDLRELLPRLADTVRAGLGARWVRVLLRDETTGWLPEPRGHAGAEPTSTSEPAALTVLLERGGEVLGRIECGPRPEGYGDRERELLDRLAAQAATALANVRLTAQLARSRERLVQAADTERRRIERDIHDGAQQQIVALLARLRLARNQVQRREREPELVLAELQDEVRQLLTVLRELAHGIHPPVLSDRGLLAAIQARADRLPFAVEVRAGADVVGTRFGADVEGASYYMICEALTNVVKHAQADEIQIDIEANQRCLHLEVHDDGAGFERNGSGRGLTGMRDRIEALGGHLDVRSAPGQGTTVEAELPLRGLRA